MLTVFFPKIFCVLLLFFASVPVFAILCDDYWIKESNEVVFENPDGECTDFLIHQAYSADTPFKIRYTDPAFFHWALEKIEFLSPLVTVETTFPEFKVHYGNKVESLLSLLKRIHSGNSPYLKIQFDVIAFHRIDFAGRLCDQFRDFANLQKGIALIDCSFVCDRESLDNAGGIIGPSSNLKKLTLGGVLPSKMTEFVNWVRRSLQSGNAWNVEMLVISHEEFTEEFMYSVAILLGTKGNNIKELGIAFANRRMARITVNALMSEFSQVDHLLILQVDEGFLELENLIAYGMSKITKITAQMEETWEIIKVMRLSALKGNSITVMHIRMINSQILYAMEQVLNSPYCRLQSLHLSFLDIEEADWRKFIFWVLRILVIVPTKIKSLTLLHFPISEIRSLMQMLSSQESEIFHLEFYPKREINVHLKAIFEMKKKQFDPTYSFRKEDFAISYYGENSNDNEDIGPEIEFFEQDNFFQIVENTLFVPVKTKDQVKSVAEFLSGIRDPNKIKAIVFEETPDVLFSDCVDAVLNFIKSPYSHIGFLAFYGHGIFNSTHMIALSKVLTNPKNVLDTLGLPHVDGSGMRVLLDVFRNESCLVHFLKYKPAGQYSIHIQEQVTQQLAKNKLKYMYKCKEAIEAIQQNKLEKDFAQYVEEQKSRKRKVSETDFDDNEHDGSSFDLWLDRGKFKLGDKFRKTDYVQE